MNILDFEPLVAKVGNPSEGLMQSRLKYSMCICWICLAFQVYSRYIVHKVCFNLLSRLLYRFSIFHISWFVFRDIDNSLMTLWVQTTLLFSRVLNYMNYFECLSTQITKHSHPSEELYRTITHQATLTQSFKHSSNARLATDLTHNCCLSFVL